MSNSNLWNRERRASDHADRRKASRSGRRASDPQARRRCAAWLFAGYAFYVGVRSLPAKIRRFFKDETPLPTA